MDATRSSCLSKTLTSTLLICVSMTLFSRISCADDLIMATGATAPYSKPDRSGFLDRIANELFMRIGHSARVNTLPAARAIKHASEGLADGDMQRIGGLEKQIPNLAAVTEPISEYQFVGFSIQPKSGISSLDNLANERVGYLRGWKFYELNLPDTKKTHIANTPAQLFELLKLGRIDIALFSKWSGFYWANKVNIDVHMIDPPFKKMKMYMYLNKRHEQLAIPLTEALKSMKRDGTYARIRRQTLEQNFPD